MNSLVAAYRTRTDGRTDVSFFLHPPSPAHTHWCCCTAMSWPPDAGLLASILRKKRQRTRVYITGTLSLYTRRLKLEGAVRCPAAIFFLSLFLLSLIGRKEKNPIWVTPFGREENRQSNICWPAPLTHRLISVTSTRAHPEMT